MDWLTAQAGHDRGRADPRHVPRPGSRCSTCPARGRRGRTASWQFNESAALAADTAHIWVANLDGASLTELNAGNGPWVATLSGGSYRFNKPAAIALADGRVWVASYGSNSRCRRLVTRITGRRDLRPVVRQHYQPRADRSRFVKVSLSRDHGLV
jgi:hypothetical protein